MDELLAQFLVEGRDLVAQAAAAFDVLARDPGNAAAIDDAFRAIHTLKGSVAIFPMAAAERTLHAAEDVLERARKGGMALDGAATGALVACLDGVDRWIDDVELRGALGEDADGVAAALITGLPGREAAAPVSSSAATPDWARQLADGAEGPVVAFRYTPDPDCFFRGEDPLAIVATIPDLLRLDIRPAEGRWPALDAIEPFRCISILEGLSTASPEVVRAAFRMMPDQIALHRFEAAAPAPTPDAPAEAGPATTLRIDAARIDALADGLGELLVAVNALAPLAARIEAQDRTLAAAVRTAQAGIERSAANLQRSVAAVRLVPLAPTLRRLPRLAREIAATLGKPIAFAMVGDGLEVDKQIAEGLSEPLLHLLRNAIDHGIEDAATRAAAGKPVEGRVTLTASREGDAVAITLADDGGGIDPARIRATAQARGLLDVEAADQLTDAAALRLIFAPGFSTAETVTGVSGRGVGMDAVQAAVEKLRGTIAIDSTPGRGTRFLLRFPANALTTRLLVVEAAGDRYGVALEHVVETVRVEQSALLPVGEGTACVLRGRTVPVLSLARLLGGTELPGAHAKLLVTSAEGERVALRVDDFADRIDAVVRPPSGLLAGVSGIGGATLLGDGGVLLVLDLPALVA
ncbi:MULTISPECIES: chemotaxis protein CheA [Sphingomonas]|uniref:Chemotaxis protein CheA n=1 Tax=Sphingomonas trueperi TaxID=53317 RepID=A0A7X6BCX2_9SPHN|nr:MULTISPECIES: chemotaxis protein CheA [Sphingomonas]NJB97291.1 two-component system chemotaxis sensor kinase CheA [Sphingomonas trueperi]RSV34363.1 chemotaxis protein CheA [Sphingomonas sp. ABOLE]